MSKPIRISEEGYNLLVELSQEDKKSMAAFLEGLLLAEKKRRFFESINIGYDQLRNNPNDWQQEIKQRQSFDKTLLDSISENEVWTIGEKVNDKSQ